MTAPFLTPQAEQALRYVQNTAGNASLDHFNEDHDPIGPKLWAELTGAWLAKVDEVTRRVVLTPDGVARLAGVPRE